MLLLILDTGYAVVEREADQRESTQWSRTLIAIAITFVLLATISFLLRLYSRQKTTWKPALEDVFMGIGLSFSYMLSTCVIIGTFDPLFPAATDYSIYSQWQAAFNWVGYNIWALPRQTQERVALVQAHSFSQITKIW